MLHVRYLIRPAASHFRLVSLSALGRTRIDQAYSRIYLPQWRFTADYERLYQAGQMPSRALNVAYTLQHMLHIVSEGSGVTYTQAFTETGKRIYGLGEVQEIAALVLGTEEDMERNKGRPKVAFKLPKLGIRHMEMTTRTNRQNTLSFPRLPLLPLSSREPKVIITRSESTVSMALVPPLAPTTRSPTPLPDIEAFLTGLFTAKEVESLQRDYIRLRHSLLPLHMSNNTPEQENSSLAPAKNTQFITIFAVYMQEAIPALRGKPELLFKAILRGAGADEEGLNWGQWLVVNSVLVYRNAPETVRAGFVDKLMAFHSSQSSLSEAPLTSVYSTLLAELLTPLYRSSESPKPI